MSKNEKDLVVHEDTDIFKRFDELDDQIILAELENKAIDEWVYHFQIGGKDIWGISKPGVDACQKELGKEGIALREQEIEYRQDPTDERFMLFSAKVIKVYVAKSFSEENKEFLAVEAKAESVIGLKRQDTMMKKSGMLVVNPFWFEQGGQKALRNAKLRMIPEDVKTKIIEFAKKKKKVRKVEPVKEEVVKKEAEAVNEPSFPGGEKEQNVEGKITNAQNMDLIRLEATLVDKYAFHPDQIMEQVEKRFGTSKHNEFSEEVADAVINFYKDTMAYNDSKRAG